MTTDRRLESRTAATKPETHIYIIIIIFCLGSSVGKGVMLVSYICNGENSSDLLTNDGPINHTMYHVQHAKYVLRNMRTNCMNIKIN